jgi:thiamine transport system ATP-binding protein
LAGHVLQVASPAELWRRPATREVAEFLGYEAFVATDSPADATAYRGTVTGTAFRRGRAEITVDVDGIGNVTALAPAGTALVALTPDPARITVIAAPDSR